MRRVRSAVSATTSLLALAVAGAAWPDAAAAAAPPSAAFTVTQRLETELRRGESTPEDVRRLLGAPTGKGSLLYAALDPRPFELWYYEDIAATGFKADVDHYDSTVRQQVLLVFFRGGAFQGFLWFSNFSPATAWTDQPMVGAGR